MFTDRLTAPNQLSIDDLRALARRRAAASGEGLPALTAHPRDGAIPLTFAQERLWFIEQLGMDSSAYNLVFALRIEGSLELSSLEGAFADLQRRHEILRTRFTAIAGTPVQEVSDSCDFRLERAVVEGATTAAREEALRSLILMQQQRRFDLSQEAPLRAVLIREDDRSHIVLIILHHIAADNWSFNIILNELSQLYSAHREGKPSPLPNLEVQYADVALWQRRRSETTTDASQLAFWMDALAGSEPLRLPADHLRPAVPSHLGSRCHFRLSQDLSRELTELAKRQNATLFMAMLTIFLVLLARSSGQRDIVVGTVISGRSDVRTEPLVGLFLNTLAIRTDLSGNLDYYQLLARVKKAATQAYAHQDVPFDRVVKALHPERDLASHPLFQVTFTLAEAPRSDIALAGLQISRISDERASAQFDLSLSIQSNDEGLAGVFEYATDIFEADTIERMRNQFIELARQIAGNPTAPVNTLPMMPAAERATLLHEWATTTDLRQDEGFVHDIIAHQAKLTPLRTAVVDERGSLTYAKLDKLSDVLAQRLRESGVRRDDLVAVYLPRGTDLIVGILGVLKAGAGYLPLDPVYYSERTLAILDDAKPRAVVAADGALECAWPLVAIDDLGDELEHAVERPERSSSDLEPGNLAYVIYTSGSTGKPKGVEVNHVGLSNLLHWYRQAYDFKPESQILVTTSSGFDLTQKNLFAPLMVGGCLNLAPEPFDPSRICTQIYRSQISHINMTPSAFYAVADNALDTGGDLSSLRHVILGGEVLNVDRLRRLGRRYPHLALTNSYGPTECTDVVTATTLGPGWSETSQMPVPIGRPIPHTRCYILDEYLQPVPPGIVGEIYIGGVGVGRGYRLRPNLTQERFLADPHAGTPAARMYRTGDLGRWRKDGFVDYLDRSDRQVKIRGFRIELADVEAEFMRFPEVKLAAVVVRDHDGEARLHAYVVPFPHAGPFNVVELRSALATKLPSYMLPATIVELDDMPVTASGKLDRNALPIPSSDPEPTDECDAPATHSEEILLEIWTSLLKIPRIGVTRNPFDLGADSLLLLRVAARTSEKFDRPVAVADFFRYPTIRDLAAFLDQTDHGPSDNQAAILADASRRLSRRISPMRRRV